MTNKQHAYGKFVISYNYRNSLLYDLNIMCPIRFRYMHIQPSIIDPSKQVGVIPRLYYHSRIFGAP